jgi:phage shock protein A
MISILKKIPWWGWLALALAILFLWQSLSGWAASRKLYDMALDNLRQDQSRIVKTLSEIVTEREMELAGVYEQLEAVKQQQAQTRAETERLRGKIRELQARRDTIIVSDNPDTLVNDLRGFGIGTAHRIKR